VSSIALKIYFNDFSGLPVTSQEKAIPLAVYGCGYGYPHLSHVSMRIGLYHHYYFLTIVEDAMGSP
jgi:hypothetical protein